MNSLTQRLSQMSPVKLALAAQSLRAKFELVNAEPIAIVGMGCRFPAGANDPESFWRVLRDGVDAVVEVPPERWDLDAFYDPDPEASDKMYTRFGTFVDNVDRFDAAFFGISPREAALMDPQQRLMLETSWEALERASLPADRLRGGSVGIFVGMMTLDYSRLLHGANLMNAYAATGNGFGFTAGRLAHALGLHGPALAIDTACSSSLVAVHLACQSLRTNECEIALAGGVSLSLSPISTLVQCRARMLSPDGRCKTFDAAANGYVKGEGCGVVVLRRLSDALAAGDNIQALIRGSAVNHDGATSGITVPNGTAQEQVMRSALANGGVEPWQVGYVEAHGTGTSLGDPIEAEALGAVYGEGRPLDEPLIVGSVKTNLGHLEGAAGIAGLIKTILSLHHEEIPPHLHLRTPSPHIRWKELPLIVPTSRRSWQRGERRRIAGVSAFGFSGTNAHLLLEEAPATAAREPDSGRWQVLTLSAKSREALESLTERYVQYLDANPDANFGDVCFTANTGRTHFPHRLSIVASDCLGAKAQLGGLAVGPPVSGKAPKIAFAYSGAAASHSRLGEELAETYPVFRDALSQCVGIAGRRAETDWFAFQYSLTALWRSWGVVPAVVMGSGAGEFATACAAGVFGLEDALTLLVSRSTGGVVFAPPRPGLVLEMAGDIAGAGIATPEYWDQRFQGPSRFDRRLDTLLKPGAGVRIEIGLGPERDECQSVMQALGAAYAQGVAVDWAAVEGGQPHRKLILPVYPFQGQRHWVDQNGRTEPPSASHSSRNDHPLLGRRMHLAGSDEIRFEAELHPDHPPFLGHHRVFDAVILPAAAYLEMAIAAAVRALATNRLILEDIVFHQALGLSAEEPATVQLSLTPQGPRKCLWKIHTAERLGDDVSWRLLASGSVGAEDREQGSPEREAWELTEPSEQISVSSHFQDLARFGLSYGPAFRALTSLRSSPGSASGTMELPSGPSPSADGFVLHPVLLDACFQLCAAAIGNGEKRLNTVGASVPVGIERLRLYQRTNGAARAHANVRDNGAGSDAITADLRLDSPEGQAIAEVEGLQFRRVSRESLLGAESTTPLPDCLYEVQWQAQANSPGTAVGLPSPIEIQAALTSRIAELGQQAGEAVHGETVGLLEDLGLRYIADAFLQLGWRYRAQDRFSTEAAAEQLGISPQYERLLARFLGTLSDVGCLRKAGQEWEVVGELPRGCAREEFQALRGSRPDADLELILLNRCGSRLADVLRGQCDPLNLLFPAGDSSTVAQVYRNSPGLAILNTVVGQVVGMVAARGGDLRILEIGGGTGGATAYILPHLAARAASDNTAYTFTDVSPEFVAEARNTFREFPFLEYRTLDIERSPEAQGFDRGVFDAVIAANALHTTRYLKETLRHVRALLKPGGLLILLEAVAPLRWLDLTFGLTTGWWRFRDRDLRPSYPLLSSSAWISLLEDSEFANAAAPKPRGESSLFAQNSVIVAQALSKPRDWLIADFGEGIGADLSALLAEAGDSCSLLTGDPALAAIQERPPSGVVLLPDLAATASDADLADSAQQTSLKVLHLIQAALRARTASPPEIVIVTRGATPAGRITGAGVAQAPLWGLGGVLALEHPELRCRMVDLEPEPDRRALQALAAEIRSASRENRVSLRSKGRTVARLVRSHTRSRTGAPVKRDAGYLITGGLGGLGLLVAQWLVSKGARYLILVGRRGLHEDARDAIRGLEQSGAKIFIRAADVAQFKSIEQVLAEASHELPPVRGVIHAAGTLDDGLILHQTEERFERAFASKVLGSWNLHRLSLGMPLDFFVMFSSAASLLGRPGQANHAAANAFMDTLAHHRRANGLAGMSINWGAWSETGKAAERRAGAARELEGAAGISPAQGIAVLEQLIASAPVQVGVIPMQWQTFSRQVSGGAAMPLLENLIQAAPSGTTRDQPSEYIQLQDAAPEERSRLIVAYLQNRVAAVLGLSGSHRPDPGQPLQDLGFDSLMGIELKSRTSLDLGVNLPMVHFMEAPNILTLAERLLEHFTLTHQVILGDGAPGQGLELLTL